MGVGVSCSCFGQFPNPERLPKGDKIDHQQVSSTSLIREFMKERCSWRIKNNIIKKKNTQQVYPQENDCQKQQLKEDKEFSTLQECLLASPVLLNSYNSSNTNVLKLKNKVYPSFVGDVLADRRGSFSKQRLPKVDNNNSGVDVSASLRSQSGKIKKRVSFKLPTEAEIFVYNIPGEENDE